MACWRPHVSHLVMQQQANSCCAAKHTNTHPHKHHQANYHTSHEPTPKPTQILYHRIDSTHPYPASATRPRASQGRNASQGAPARHDSSAAAHVVVGSGLQLTHTSYAQANAVNSTRQQAAAAQGCITRHAMPATPARFNSQPGWVWHVAFPRTTLSPLSNPANPAI